MAELCRTYGAPVSVCIGSQGLHPGLICAAPTALLWSARCFEVEESAQAGKWEPGSRTPSKRRRKESPRSAPSRQLYSKHVFGDITPGEAEKFRQISERINAALHEKANEPAAKIQRGELRDWDTD